MCMDGECFYSCGDPQPVEFGATATVAVIRGRELWLAYVGDR